MSARAYGGPQTGWLQPFFFQAEDGIRDGHVTGVQTCALPISQLLDMLRPRRVEPTASLDPAGTQHIEELCHELKTRYTICIVTHNLQQAARVSDYTADRKSVGEGKGVELGGRRSCESRTGTGR